MKYEYGQVWKDRKMPDKAAFVIAEEGEFVWYSVMTLRDPEPRRRSELLGPEVQWTKAKADAFEKRYEMTKHPIRTGVFWKSKATKEIVRIHGVNDNGHSAIRVNFLMQSMSVENFVSYYEPCTLMEQAEYIVANIKQPDPPAKSRIESIEEDGD